MTSSRERAQFDEILEKVIEELPDDAAAMLDEVALIVEDEPAPELLRDLAKDPEHAPYANERPGESTLCGLHSGRPLTERSVFEVDLPGQIQIFRGPILRLAEWDPEKLEQQIRITLIHELGHHFGLDEDDMHRLGYE